MGNQGEFDFPLVEARIWGLSVIIGFAVAGVMAGLLFAYFLIFGLIFSIEFTESVQASLSILIVLRLLISKTILPRLQAYATHSFLSTWSWAGTVLTGIINIEADQANEQFTETNPFQILAFSLLSGVFFSFFLISKWTCPTANSTGGLTHATCLYLADTNLFVIQITIVRMLYSATGISGLFFAAAVGIDLRRAYRESIINRAIDRLYENYWINPWTDSKFSDDN